MLDQEGDDFIEVALHLALHVDQSDFEHVDQVLESLEVVTLLLDVLREQLHYELEHGPEQGDLDPVDTAQPDHLVQLVHVGLQHEALLQGVLHVLLEGPAVGAQEFIGLVLVVVGVVPVEVVAQTVEVGVDGRV